MTIITTTKEMRPRDPNDFYPTPASFVDAALRTVDSLMPAPPRRILDPGAGTGVWGDVARRLWSRAHITGVELRETERPSSYDEWIVGDFRLEHFTGFDLVMGNIPYMHAEAFLKQMFHSASEGGIVMNLLRLAFLEGQDRGRGFWRRYPPLLVEVCSSRPSFTGNGKTDATAYAMYYWRKGWHGETRLDWLRL